MSTYRPGGFQILPPVIKNLLIINVLVFAITNLAGPRVEEFMYVNFALFHWQSPLFKPWQLFTHMFMHGDFMHLLFNMLALWMFGKEIENELSSKRFILFYLVCGIGASLCYLGVLSLSGSPALNVPMVGASGAIFGLLFAFGYLYPNVTIYFNLLFPIKAKYFVAIYAAIELFTGIANRPGDNVAHFAHLGGMLFAFILLKIWTRRKPNNYY